QRPGRAAQLDQAPGAHDLPDRLLLLSDGLCGRADRGAVHHPAHRIPAPALRAEGKEMTATPAPSVELAANRRDIRPGRIIAWTLLLIGGLIMVTPLLYMFSTSLKTSGQVYDLRLIPAAPTLDNYIKVLGDGRFLRWFFNSLFVATAVTLSNVFFDSLVGYTLAKFQFRGRYFIFLAILSTLMIPTEMLVIPWYLMSSQLGWLDSYWGIMFPGMMTAFGTFLMKQFFEGVPDDFLEAARVDGLNEFTIWWKVAMPLVTPAVSALAIFTFLGNWTAFFWPLIV